MSNIIKTEEEFLTELKKSFLVECDFMLEECEEAFMNLESAGSKQEELNRIFRLVHSMKGSSGSIGFLHFSHFAHSAEELLCILRVKEELCSTEIISLLLEINDRLKNYVATLKQDLSAEPHCVDLVERINKFVSINHLPEQSESLKNLEKDKSGSQNEGFYVFEENAPKNYAPNIIDNNDEELLFKSMPKEEIYSESLNIKSKCSEGETDFEQKNITTENVNFEIKNNNLMKVTSEKEQGQNKSAIVKLSADRIDSVLDLVGELVVVKSQLICNEILTVNQDQHLSSLLVLLDKIVRELQEKALSMRMTSIRPLFLKVNRAVRDLSLKLNKPVEFTMSGEETEIDRAVFESLGDPLMHLCRNALDHGIEAKEERQVKGKNEIGKINLAAGYQSGRVFIDIEDDGGGIIRDKVIRRALLKGLLPNNDSHMHMNDAQVYDLLFAPGFSTAEVVSEISGRGVGLDVVKSHLEQVKGNIEITSRPGEGTRFRLWIPLTTAIADAMKVRVNNDVYALPMENICELLQPDFHAITRLSNKNEVIQVRGNFLPLIRLRKWVKNEINSIETEAIEGTQTVVVVEERGTQVALLVDEVLGQSQIVIKGLGDVFKHVKGIGGGAILGDGKVGLILDLEGLISSAHKDKSHNISIEKNLNPQKLSEAN
ncbi:chemotaxis protein CheA [Fluviispira sanaruensis]|uniref:Chemotaxis protein CheA n=1 Tax=Fluviispira sanaruensis TaxID=2493639 RepID=A0A4V0P2E6_FLUSA|nr:chemotaxis protein CheA [Fluviispira sanaruensis]BBH52957.1 chemotaxis protein CheA [Fluviispira sanaruensis]